MNTVLQSRYDRKRPEAAKVDPRARLVGNVAHQGMHGVWIYAGNPNGRYPIYAPGRTDDLGATVEFDKATDERGRLVALNCIKRQTPFFHSQTEETQNANRA